MYICYANQKHLGCKKARPIRISSYLTITTQLHKHANRSLLSAKPKN